MNWMRRGKEMPNKRSWIMLGAGALCSAVVFTPLAAVSEDDPGAKAIKTRQGYMDVVVWEAGPLFGMAKGEVPYDAASASAHAANLKAIAGYDYASLFLPGTSKADRPGKTRALADIWADTGKFEQAIDDWRSAVDVVAAEAGKGQQALVAAVGELGKSCGGCHKPFRADDF
jgi:cytochrome c556